MKSQINRFLLIVMFSVFSFFVKGRVSDLKGWKNTVAVQYGIRAVPSNFLINPTGKIIAQDLRGQALLDFLTKILN